MVTDKEKEIINAETEEVGRLDREKISTAKAFALGYEMGIDAGTELAAIKGEENERDTSGT